ncbi:MAG: TlpA family protein disulfide reductase, partial [Methanobacteriota archaeon]
VLHADEIHEWINSNSKDTLLIVNVWASWCVPCREEFPLLMRAAKEYRNTPVRFAFISADFKSDTSKAREFLIGQGFTGIAYWKRGDDQEFINNLAPEWSGALPVTIFFLNGKRLFYHEGIINESLLNEKIQSFLKRR